MKKYKVETKVINNFNDKITGELKEIGETLILDRFRYEELYSKGFVDKGKIIEERPKVSYKKEEE